MLTAAGKGAHHCMHSLRVVACNRRTHTSEAAKSFALLASQCGSTSLATARTSACSSAWTFGCDLASFWKTAADSMSERISAICDFAAASCTDSRAAAQPTEMEVQPSQLQMSGGGGGTEVELPSQRADGSGLGHAQVPSWQ